MTSRRGASMPAGARISIDVLALPVKSAARAALLTAPLVRSSKPRAVGASASSAPASSASAPVGAADSDTNWISRASDIDRFQRQVERAGGNCGSALAIKEDAARPTLRSGMVHNTPSQAKRKQATGREVIASRYRARCELQLRRFASGRAWEP